MIRRGSAGAVVQMNNKQREFSPKQLAGQHSHEYLPSYNEGSHHSNIMMQNQQAQRRFNSLEMGNSGSRHYEPNMHNDFKKKQYDEEKMLIEQDPFLLEEQRYLNRMQRAHNN